MTDTIDKLLQVNDESLDETRGLQPGETARDADGRYNTMLHIGAASPLVTDDNHPLGTLWLNTVTKSFYSLVDNTPGAAVWSIGDITSEDVIALINENIAGIAPRPISLYYANTERKSSTGSTKTMPLDTTAFEDSDFFDLDDANDEVEVLDDARIVVDVDITTDNVDKSSAALINCWIELNGVEIDGTQGEITVAKTNFGGNAHMMSVLDVVNGDRIRCRFKRIEGSAQVRTLRDGCRIRIRIESTAV